MHQRKSLWLLIEEHGGYVRTVSLAGNLVHGFCKAFDITSSNACHGNPSVLCGVYRVLKCHSISESLGGYSNAN